MKVIRSSESIHVRLLDDKPFISRGGTLKDCTIYPFKWPFHVVLSFYGYTHYITIYIKMIMLIEDNYVMMEKIILN